MKEESILKTLAAAAREDRPPSIDVTDRVLAGLTAQSRSQNVVLWIYTSLSAAAAAAVLLIASRAAVTYQDPFGEFLQSIATVTR